MDSPASLDPEDAVAFAQGFSTLLESLYAGILSDRGFENFLHGLQQQFDSCSVVLTPIVHELRQHQRGWAVGVPASLVQWYRENELMCDDAAIKKLQAVMADGFVSAKPLFGDKKRLDGVAGRLGSWAKKAAIVDSAGLVIPASDQGHLLLALQRDESAGKFVAADIGRMNLLVPHLRQAMELATRLSPPEKMPLTAESIQKHFNLTPTEALVSMMLAENISLKEIARLRNVSVYTVREQIRLAFKKTGCTCQRELVAAILRMSLA